MTLIDDNTIVLIISITVLQSPRVCIKKIVRSRMPFSDVTQYLEPLDKFGLGPSIPFLSLLSSPLKSPSSAFI